MATIGRLIDGATQKLLAAGIDEAAAHAELIAAHVLGKSRTYVRAFGQQAAGASAEAAFNKILAQRLAGRPLAYILGEAEFTGRVFKVNPAVLIPRPETEELVEQAVKKLQTPPQYILDLCAGSGCIAISLAFIFKSARIVSADISGEALKVALKNARNLNIAERVDFVKSDLFNKVQGTFDFIISNPPYIPEETISTLSPEVRSEPRVALCGGKDGLEIIERIVAAAPKYLNSGGLLALEIGCGQAEKVVKFFKGPQWRMPQTGKDVSGIERFVFARSK
jgi:release factor glutamine methyltransferase